MFIDLCFVQIAARITKITGRKHMVFLYDSGYMSYLPTDLIEAQRKLNQA